MTPPAPPTDLARDADALVARLVAAYPGEADAATARVVQAPGRVNLIGEHTDYNEGFVLPVAIDLGISIALVADRRPARRESRSRRPASATASTSTRSARRRGDLDRLRRGHGVGAARGRSSRSAGSAGVLESDLPQGSGLSSSAAFELASALALSGGEAPGSRPDDARPDRPAGRERVRRRQLRADGPVRVGVRGAGQRAAARLPDRWSTGPCRCRRRGGARRRATRVLRGGWRRPRYNERRSQCEAAVAAIGVGPGVTALRDVTPAMLEAHRARLDPFVAARARAHRRRERAGARRRSRQSRQATSQTVGRLFAASHASMRDLFEISSPELDALVDIATGVAGVFGARLTGAGFGGCTINLVRRDAAPALREAVLRTTGREPGSTPACSRSSRAAAQRSPWRGADPPRAVRRAAPPLRPAARRVGARVAGPDEPAVAGRRGAAAGGAAPGLRPDLLPVPRQHPGERRRPTRPTTPPSCSRTTSPRCGPTTSDATFDDGLLRAEGERGDVPRPVLLAAPRPDPRADGAGRRPPRRRPVGRPDGRARAAATAGSRCSRTAARRWAPPTRTRTARSGPGPRCPRVIAARGRGPARLSRSAPAARCCSTYAALEADGPRVVVEANEHWLALVPFWAVWPFEMLLVAERPVARLPDLDDGAARRAGRDPRADAPAVRRAVRCPVPVLDGLARRAVRRGRGDRRLGQLHAHVFPPLLRSASVRKFMVGYELLAEAQRDVTPEDAAARLRALEID